MSSPRSIARAAARGNSPKRRHRQARARNLRTIRQSETAQHPAPHTLEWYDRLIPIKPAQAMMTADVVSKAGSIDVCSICGDAPASIYDTLESPFLSIRLCEACLALQRLMFDVKVRISKGGA